MILRAFAFAFGLLLGRIADEVDMRYRLTADEVNSLWQRLRVRK